MVSTVSASLAAQLGLPIQPLDELLCVRGAGDFRIQYDGYVAATTHFPSLGGEAVVALYLVVPNTLYHDRVPVLVN